MNSLDDVGYRPEHEDVPGAEISDAITNVKKIADNYVTLSAAIGDNVMLSDYEKAQQRYNVLKVWEDGIKKIIDGSNLNSLYNINANVYWACISYKRVVAVLNLCRLQKEAGHGDLMDTSISDHVTRTARKEAGLLGDKRKGDKNDEKLTPDQMDGIREIDSWVIRNFHKSGWFSRAHTERADLVQELLNKSPRERLCIYYMVEKRARLTPSIMAVAESQTTYTPKLEVFRKQMRCSWARIYRRAKTGHLYWNKLREAMAITDQSTPFISAIQKGINNSEDPEHEKKVLQNKADELELEVNGQIVDQENGQPIPQVNIKDLPIEKQIELAEKKTSESIDLVIDKIILLSRVKNGQVITQEELIESGLEGLMNHVMENLKDLNALRGNADAASEIKADDQKAQLIGMSEAIEGVKGTEIGKWDKADEFLKNSNATFGNTANMIRAV